MTAIHAVGITHTYNGKDIILNGIDLDVEKGEFLSILGASGSGKTTLFLTLLGTKPYEGSITLDGKELRKIKRKDIYKKLCEALKKGELKREEMLYSAAYVLNLVFSAATSKGF